MLNEAIAHYKNIEESLQNTLLMAQQTSEEIKRNSYQRRRILSKKLKSKLKK